MAQILARLARKSKPLSYKQMTANLNAMAMEQRTEDTRKARGADQMWEQYLVDQGVIAESERVA